MPDETLEESFARADAQAWARIMDLLCEEEPLERPAARGDGLGPDGPGGSA